MRSFLLVRTGFALGLAVAWCAVAAAQEPSIAPPPTRVVPYYVHSGPVMNTGRDVDMVFATVVTVENAAWLRLHFSDVALSGDPAANGAYLRITSTLDGASQYLNGESIAQWANTSAYFNGDTVLVELYAHPDTGPSTISIWQVWAGEPPQSGGPDSLCGADDRVLSSDPRCARHSVGCSSWLINDLNHQFMTAGHCGASSGHVMMFNVPLSTSSGQLVNPPPEDQYSVEPLSAAGQGVNGGIGNDYQYFGVNPNSNTGLQPYQKQGAAFTLADAPTSPTGQTIRITGYGTVSSPVSPTWNQVQKTHADAMASLTGTTVKYYPDTTGGNSGSPVIHENTGNAVGVHTHAGCTSGGNQGTAYQHTGWKNVINNPKGVCRTGSGTPGGPLFAIGDLANNFGTVSTTTGNFAKVAQGPAQMQGLAFNRNTGKFYGIDTARKLYEIDKSSGAVATLGTVGGTTATINGLAYDPVENKLYGIAQAAGQLLLINVASLSASNIGAATGGTVGALDYDVATGTLYGIDDAGGSKLVSFDAATGAKTVIGALGAGTTDCNGLGWVEADGNLYTIDAANENVYRVNKASGAATLVGSSGGLFGAAFAMGGEQQGTQVCTADLDGDGKVCQPDLGILLAAYGAGPGDPGYNAAAGNLAAPATVGQEDLGILLAQYGACGGACP